MVDNRLREVAEVFVKLGLIALASLGVTFGFKKLNSAFIVLGGAALGYLLWQTGG